MTLGPALACVALAVAGCVFGLSCGVLPIDAAQAQSTQPSPVDRARTAVETLINRLRGRDMPAGIEKANGNIEATQVDLAAKYSGRVGTLTVDEGDEVTAGQLVGTIWSPDTEAQLRAAQAQVLKAKKALAEAVATIAQRKTDLDFTRTDYERGKALIKDAYISQQMLDLRRNKFETAEAAYVAANAQRDEAEAAIKAAEADAAAAVDLVDLVLLSPRSGRVQYRLARTGEMVAANQRVLTILDLRDVYVTIYLPWDVAGRLTLGDEARVIADPLPQYVIPATVRFVATDPQFTPKSVETAEERHKMLYRVKLQATPRSSRSTIRFLIGCPRPRLRAHRSQNPLAQRACGEASLS